MHGCMSGRYKAQIHVHTRDLLKVCICHTHETMLLSNQSEQITLHAMQCYDMFKTNCRSISVDFELYLCPPYNLMIFGGFDESKYKTFYKLQHCST